MELGDMPVPLRAAEGGPNSRWWCVHKVTAPLAHAKGCQGAFFGAQNTRPGRTSSQPQCWCSSHPLLRSALVAVALTSGTMRRPHAPASHPARPPQKSLQPQALRHAPAATTITLEDEHHPRRRRAVIDASGDDLTRDARADIARGKAPGRSSRPVLFQLIRMGDEAWRVHGR